MNIAPAGERPQHLKMAGGQAREPEQRDPIGEVDERRVLEQPRAGAAAALGGAGQRDPGSQPPPQFGLPGVGGGQRDTILVEVEPLGPGSEHRRTVQRVAIEQPCQVAHGAEPPRIANRVRSRPGATEVGGERDQPWLVDALLDHLEQRPDRALGQPRIELGVDSRGDRDRFGDQRVGGGEGDAGADPVGASARGPEHERQPLGQPALHPAGRHGDQFLSERIRERARAERGQSIGEPVGAFGAVKVKHRVPIFPPGPVGLGPRSVHKE